MANMGLLGCCKCMPSSTLSFRVTGVSVIQGVFCLFCFLLKVTISWHSDKDQTFKYRFCLFSFIHPVSSAWFLLKVREQNISQVTAKFRQQVSPLQGLARAWFICDHFTAHYVTLWTPWLVLIFCLLMVNPTCFSKVQLNLKVKSNIFLVCSPVLGYDLTFLHYSHFFCFVFSF